MYSAFKTAGCRDEVFQPRIVTRDDKLTFEVDSTSDVILARVRKEKIRCGAAGHDPVRLRRCPARPAPRGRRSGAADVTVGGRGACTPGTLVLCSEASASSCPHRCMCPTPRARARARVCVCWVLLMMPMNACDMHHHDQVFSFFIINFLAMNHRPLLEKGQARGERDTTLEGPCRVTWSRSCEIDAVVNQGCVSWYASRAVQFHPHGG